jgi:hypothetical protein
MFSVKSLSNGYADKPKNGPDPHFAVSPDKSQIGMTGNPPENDIE